MRRPTGRMSEAQATRRLLLRDSAARAQQGYCLTAALYAAFAAEAYANEFLAAHLSKSDFEAVDRMATVDKLVVGGQLAVGEPLFVRDDELIQPISQLFGLRNKLAHPKLGFAPQRADPGNHGQGTFERQLDPRIIAKQLVAVAGAGRRLTQRMPRRRAAGLTPADLYPRVIWTGRPAVIAYAERVAALPEQWANAEPRLFAQAWDWDARRRTR